MARLEAALERIAVLTASRPAPQQAQPDAASAEVKARLDTMIARIRAAIDEA